MTVWVSWITGDSLLAQHQQVNAFKTSDLSNFSGLLITDLLANMRTYPAVVICMAECGTNPPAFLLQTAGCGLFCLAHYNQRISCVFRLILLATGEHEEAKDITCIKKAQLLIISGFAHI